VGYADLGYFGKKGAVVTLGFSRVTAPILTILAHDVATILPFNIFELELPYSYAL